VIRLVALVVVRDKAVRRCAQETSTLDEAISKALPWQWFQSED